MSPRRRDSESHEPDLFSIAPTAAVAYTAEGSLGRISVGSGEPVGVIDIRAQDRPR